MIKNIALSISKPARNQLAAKPLKPAVLNAFKFIGSLTMLVGGVLVLPSDLEQLNGFFKQGNTQNLWIQKRMSESARLSVFVSCERFTMIRVEARWFLASEQDASAELIAMFDDVGPVSTSSSHRQTFPEHDFF